MTDVPDLMAPARTQIGWLTDGVLTGEALLDHYLDRHHRLHGRLNAVVAIDVDGARPRAREIDRRRAAGDDVGPLAGLPMTIKDVYDVDGMPASSGVPKLAKRPSTVAAEADVVRLLHQAGAVIWGKTNTPRYAGDVQTYNKVYGTTNNPYDPSRTPGGSSGGSAAALAVGLTALEVGSDIGGSLRNPAHSCGVCALKPTHGLVSLAGHVPPDPGVVAAPPDLAVAGPMARTVDDLALLLSILAPGSTGDPAVDTLTGLRIARWEEPAFAIGAEVDAALTRTVGLIGEAGADVSPAPVGIEGTELIDVYIRLLVPIVTAAMPSAVRRVLGAASPLAARRTSPGTFDTAASLVATTQSTDEIRSARRRRAEFQDACDELFRTIDVLVAPATAVPAIPHNNRRSLFRRTIEVDGETLPYTSLFQWISLATACHLPAAVVPVATSADGLPIGVQVIGNRGDDHRVVAVAGLVHDLVRNHDGAVAPPALLPEE
ncbi:MAG: amidase family protein [Actinomycetota bacterium]